MSFRIVLYTYFRYPFIARVTESSLEINRNRRLPRLSRKTLQYVDDSYIWTEKRTLPGTDGTDSFRSSGAMKRDDKPIVEKTFLKATA